MTIPMPAFLRAWQQSWFYQAVLVPFVIGYGGSLLLLGCLKNGIFHLDAACWQDAFSGYAISLITVFVRGHSVGSAQFASNGTDIPAATELKKLADAAVAVQKRADDTSDIKVEPEQAIAAANIVSQISDDVKMAANIVQKTASV